MRSIARLFTVRGIVKWILLLVIVGVLIWYGAFQARFLIKGPLLTLSPDTAVLHDSRVTTVVGTARNVVAITLNDRPIFTDDDGNFREQLVLENGYTIMTVRARDRYGREKILTQPFVYTPAYETETQEP